MQKNEKYNIGLDIGTNSVGWAVVSSRDFNVIKKGHKKLWGARLFDEAKTAADRRLFRSTRRRLDRRRERIKLLQEIFKEEINKIDSNFFKKMKESFYNEKDENKTIKITKEEKDQIKKYNEKYPTIYHLRKDLMENNSKMDIRLVYLGLHHIIKNRGNFLYTGDFNVQNLNILEKTKNIFITIAELDNSIGLDINTYELINYEKLSEAFLEPSKKDKELKIKEILKKYVTKDFLNEFTKLMIGNKSKMQKLFALETEENISISFKGSEYEDNFDKLSENLEDKIEILEQLKELYDMIFLKNLFKGESHTSISKLMISKYGTHKNDLKLLKTILRENKKEYHKMFKNTEKEKCLYEKYLSNKISTKDFMNEIKKALSAVIDLKDSKDIVQKLDNEEFMPRITDTDNGKYPYQLHKTELLQIIENQGKYYPFLLDKINGVYKIEKLLTFRIPYYVGPLGKNTNTSNEENKNYWMVRKTNEKITPFNFDKVVDLDASAEKFITRMISHCTYLLEEKAMPANSILYSKFKVLNELKQIKVDNHRLSVEQIQNIYSNLFLTTDKNITETIFRNYIKASEDFIVSENFEISGYSANKKFANNMKPYVDFFGVNGIFKETNYNIEDAEQIIKWRTIFEDNYILERKLKENYKELDETKIKKIIAKRYKGWSRLSEKLLTTKYYENETDKSKNSIMDLMEKTNKNFMQIINDDTYNFQKMINEYNEIKDTNKLDYSVVSELATSPATKRAIYQALKVVDEIVSYIGYDPENIMIEMTRNNGKKGRIKSRKEQLLEQYKQSKPYIENYNRLYKEIENTDEKKFNSEKLYLYYIQEGKSLYSGEPLNVENLKQYEVDHIIPRTLIKDDSIDNKALVIGKENQDKAASFVLPRKFRNDETFAWWEHLKKCGLMSDKKIGRLKRSYYSDDDINGFINRQIVETSQIVKHVANILNNYYKNTKVIYLKSRLSSDFRNKYELFKYRDINNFHHMHDAYLAVVLGYYTTYFLRKIDYEKLKEENYKNYLKGTYKDNKRYGFVINNIETNVYDKKTGEVYLIGKEFVNTIVKTLHNFDGLISKKTEIYTGEFYNQNLSKKGTKGAKIHKGLDENLYGAYSGVNPSYASLVKFTKKGKEKRRMIGIPVYIDIQNKKDNSLKTNYIKKLLDLNESDEVEIIKDKIPFNALLNWDGQICYLVGATDKVEVCNAKEFIIDAKHLDKWKYTLNKLINNKSFPIKKLKELGYTEDDLVKKYDNDLSEIIIYIVDKVDKEYKLYSNLVNQMKDMFKYNDIKSLEIEEKEVIIKQMLNLLRANSLIANLKLLNKNYSGVFGRKHSRMIEHTKIINKSVTGIYEVENEF